MYDIQLRRVRSLSAAIAKAMAEYGSNVDDFGQLENLAGMYDCLMHCLEGGETSEARAAFELGYLMGKRDRSVELTAKVAGLIWPVDGDWPQKEEVERIVTKLTAMLESKGDIPV